MTFFILFLVLALIVQGGLFYYSYRVKQKSKKDDVLLKYNINSRSELFAAICRNDLPIEDNEKLNLIYTDKKEI